MTSGPKLPTLPPPPDLTAMKAKLQAQQAAARASAEAKLAELRAQPPPTLPTLPPSPTLPELPASFEERLETLKRERRQRTVVRVALLVALVVLVLFLVRDCSCAPPPVAVVEEPELVCPPVPECGPAKKAKPKPPTKKPLSAKVPPQDRDRLAVPKTANPPWLAELRLQVTARSVDLAVCFNGAEKPGALRWSTTVSPLPGTVSDSVIEPVLKGPPLSNAQKDCVLRTLSTRPYRLTPEGEDDWGSRVSLVLEF